MPNIITARALKVTAVVDAAEVAKLAAEGPRVAASVEVAGFGLAVDFNGKSLRKVQEAIRVLGAESVAVIVQGRLSPERDAILEAGIVAQPRVKAPAPEAVG
jgi:hypothetical protein